MNVRNRRNLDELFKEFSINELLAEHNAQFAIIVNVLKKVQELYKNLSKKIKNKTSTSEISK